MSSKILQLVYFNFYEEFYGWIQHSLKRKVTVRHIYFWICMKSTFINAGDETSWIEINLLNIELNPNINIAKLIWETHRTQQYDFNVTCDSVHSGLRFQFWWFRTICWQCISVYFSCGSRCRRSRSRARWRRTRGEGGTREAKKPASH